VASRGALAGPLADGGSPLRTRIQAAVVPAVIVAATAQDAPESVHDERFNQVWAGGAGSSHWGC